MKLLSNQLRLLLIATQFYTRIPITGKLAQWAGYSPELLSISTRYFTLVGAGVGAACAGLFYLTQFVLPPSIAVILSLCFGVLITGAFHEDGWADFCDAFGGHQTREKTLQIMTDSRIGSYGAIGTVLLFALKITALISLSAQPVLCAASIVIMHTASRAFAVLTMACLTYAKPLDDSKAKPITQGLTARNWTIALLIALLTIAGLLIALAPDVSFQPTSLAACLALMTLGWWRLCVIMEHRIGGYTGDGLGATQQLTETLGLVGLLVSM